MRGYRFHGFARFLLCGPFSAFRVHEFTAFPGSPVDAFSIPQASFFGDCHHNHLPANSQVALPDTWILRDLRVKWALGANQVIGFGHWF
jgi:hypothetical protein